MKLEHSFTVPASVDEAWRVLTDIERVAPCMPGASLTSVDGDDFTGTVKVKLGPIGLTYQGKASFVEKDEAAHRAVLDAQGKDSRGNGTAAAKVTANLAADGDGTRVEVVTDLNITGKPAQFGRGVMVDVGNKLIGQFADCLAGKLAGGDGAAGPAETPSAAASSQPPPAPAASAAPGPQRPTEVPPAAGPQSTPERQPAAEPQPIDLMASAGPAVAKRVAPVAGGVAVLTVLIVLLRRRRRRRANA